MIPAQRQGNPTGDLRSCPRVRVAAPFACAFSRLGLNRWTSAERGGLGVVLDVSMKGAKVMSVIAMKPGDHLVVSLRLPDQTGSMNVDATVRWEKDNMFGVEFASISQSSESRLKKFLSRTATS
ncbi:PilZ domain-containing protein [Petrachloros mirabilis]